MTRPEYTRYTLRLGRAGGEGSADRVDQDYAHPQAVALVRDLQPAGWQEEDHGDTLIFWLAKGEEAEAPALLALENLRTFGLLEASHECSGWEETWRRFHVPHVIGRLNVRPSWFPARHGLLDIIVDPGLAFGTGGHASTRQCLEEIQRIPRGSLLDVGSGSGIVSLAALRLGFGPVWGIDIDPFATHTAVRNAAINGLSPTFFVGDATDPGCVLPPAETVVANVALAEILRLAERCVAGAGGGAGCLRPAHFLLAGLLVGQGEEAAEAFPLYEEVARREDGDWLMVHLSRRG